MCGIAGQFGAHSPEQAKIDSTLNLMKQRGPDAKGWARVGNSARPATLLFARLSILDLDERASQPFRFGNKTLIFNGELYNYLEIKQKLIQEGRTFKTTSDTEVVIQAIDAWGTSVLEQFEGMWAFALHDAQDNSVLLSRDRFGEKPLYYAWLSENLYFGSEVKFLTNLSGHRFPINLDHLKRFLVNGYKSLYKTKAQFFHGLHELPSGSVMRVDNKGHAETWRYWQPTFQENPDMTLDEAIKGTRERLIRSVELRLRADVPIAFCMSGGVDSNALISIASKILGYNVHGFTIVNTDDRYSENNIIEATVKELNVKHTNIHLNKEGFLPRFRQLVRYHDAPVYTITYYTHWLLQEGMSKAGYKISISGTAADELFTGYYDHHLAYFSSIQKNPGLHRRSVENWKRQVAPYVRNKYLSNPDYLVNAPFSRKHIYLDSEDFSKQLYHPWREPFREEFYCESLLRNRMLNEIFHEATPVILHEDDLNSMYYSIENRSPFLDRNLFEFASTIPTEHLIQEGLGKYVLRKAVEGIVPDVVLKNPRKVGFNAPLLDLLDLKAPAVREELSGSSPIFDIVKKSILNELFEAETLSDSVNKFLFNFVSAKIFMEEFS